MKYAPPKYVKRRLMAPLSAADRAREAEIEEYCMTELEYTSALTIEEAWQVRLEAAKAWERRQTLLTGAA